MKAPARELTVKVCAKFCAMAAEYCVRPELLLSVMADDFFREVPDVIRLMADNPDGTCHVLDLVRSRKSTLTPHRQRKQKR